MKKIVALLVISFMLQACGLNGPRIKRKYTLENGTNREIQIDFYIVASE
jgi:major membrane immunogen (membrane-anchored lipoprotein)